MGKCRPSWRNSNRTTIPPLGMLPISVPAAVDGWFELHAKFRQAAVDAGAGPGDPLRRGGVPGQRAHRVLLGPQRRDSARATSAPARSSKPTRPTARRPARGRFFKNPSLARTYRLIAEQGRDVFYRAGSPTRSTRLCGPTVAGSGRLSSRSTRRTWVEPLSTNYRGYDVYELPPNGQGIATLQMLNILEGFDLKKWDFSRRRAARHDRDQEAGVRGPCQVLRPTRPSRRWPVKWLVSKEYATERRKLIDPARAGRS